MSRATKAELANPGARAAGADYAGELAQSDFFRSRVPVPLTAAVLSLLLAGPLLADRAFSGSSPAAAQGMPTFRPDPLPGTLKQQFEQRKFRLDERSGNYLSPKVFARTRHENLLPVSIGGRYLKDLKGQTVFLRESVRAMLLSADEAMFAKKHQHVAVTYGFRSNATQQELFDKLNGKGKVAPAGGSFHETGMALDVSNWRDAQRFMIDAGFVGGCYGIEEDLVHYSIDEITKASNIAAFKRCTLKEIPGNILKGVKKVGKVTIRPFKRH